MPEAGFTALGKVGLVNKGVYTGEPNSFDKYDFVQYGDSTYMATRDGVSGPPGEGLDGWQVLAKGVTGETGAAAIISGATADISGGVGEPEVTVDINGEDSNRSFAFHFSNLKGETGEQGQEGAIGPAGPDGPQGEKGDTGVGVKSLEIQSDGHLHATLTDETDSDAGAIKLIKESIVEALGYIPNKPWKTTIIELYDSDAKPVRDDMGGIDDLGYKYYWDIEIEGYTTKNPLFIQLVDPLNYSDFFQSNKFDIRNYSDGHIEIISNTNVTEDGLNFQVLIGPEIDEMHFTPAFINPTGITKDIVVNALGYEPVGGQGVNLLTGTRDFSGDNWKRRNIWNVENEQYNGLTVLSKGYEWGGVSQFFYAKAGETYTFSTYVKTDIPLSCYMMALDSYDTYTPQATIEGGATFAISCTTEWKKYVRSVKVAKDGYLGFKIEKSDTSSNKIYICGYKLERGTVTDPVWTPSPQDLVLKGEVDGRNRLENSLNPTIGQYGGSNVHVEKNVNVTEWTANDAIRIYGNKGNDNIVALINTGVKNIPVGSSLCTSVYIKNNGKYNIHFSDALFTSYKTIPSGGIGKYYVSRKIDASSYLSQLLFAMEDSGDFDFIIWHPKIEFGDTPTDWTPAPEDVVVRSELEGVKTTIPIRGDQGETFSNVLKSRTNQVTFLRFSNPNDNPFSFQHGFAIAFHTSMLYTNNQFKLIGTPNVGESIEAKFFELKQADELSDDTEIN